MISKETKVIVKIYYNLEQIEKLKNNKVITFQKEKLIEYKKSENVDQRKDKIENMNNQILIVQFKDYQN